MTNEKYLISLISSALNGEKIENPPKSVDFSKIYAIAKRHCVTELLSYAVDQLEIKPSEDFCEKMRKEQMTGIMKEVYQDTVLTQFISLCNENKIPVLPLKGSVIKNLYPHAYLRNMCDMDLLVNEKDLDKAGKLLEKIGLRYEISGAHDRSYKKPPFICVELHFKMTDNTSNIASTEYYESIWQLAHPKSEGEYLYSLSESDFFVFLLEHLCKHYRNGGIGIKAFSDVYLYLKNYQDKINMEYVDGIFDRFGIKKFAHHAINLAFKWFGGKDGDEVSDEMESYVLSGGAFGSFESSRAASHSRSKKRGESASQFGFIVRKIFPPYKKMCIMYPSLKGKAILLPFYWIYRWFNRLFSKKGVGSFNYKADEQKIAFYDGHMQRLGLEGIKDER